MRKQKLRRIVGLSLASGVAWAAIGLVIGSSMMEIIWGGVAIAPLIGLGMGFASSLFPTSGAIRRAVFSLASLYVAAALFGLGMGTYDLVAGPNSGEGWQRIPSAVVLQAVAATLWGITFSGYVAILWPLCHANHHLLSREWKAGVMAGLSASSGIGECGDG